MYEKDPEYPTEKAQYRAYTSVDLCC